MKRWSCAIAARDDRSPKGPRVRRVPASATATVSNDATAAPGGPKRSAAAMRSGKTTNAISCPAWRRGGNEEDCGADCADHDGERQRLERPPYEAPTFDVREEGGEGEEKRRDDQVAHRVAQPPVQPVSRDDVTPELRRRPEGAHAGRCAGHGAQPGGEKDQGEDIACPVERDAEIHPAQQECAERRFQGISHRDGTRDGGGSPGRQVGQQRTRDERGEDAVSEEKHGRERDAGRCPDQGDDLVARRHEQPELARADVGAGNRQLEAKGPKNPHSEPFWTVGCRPQVVRVRRVRGSQRIRTP
ncbi:MAG: hypothetical protein FD180_2726 [Planctomycetota bacterium]|nr:MAG: hypothetical protein FD180_2726 [Planctomycetota bacterium]